MLWFSCGSVIAGKSSVSICYTPELIFHSVVLGITWSIYHVKLACSLESHYPYMDTLKAFRSGKSNKVLQNGLNSCKQRDWALKQHVYVGKFV